MSGKEGRECTNTGTNNQGNDYRSYNDGAYAYENKGKSEWKDDMRDGRLECLFFVTR